MDLDFDSEAFEKKLTTLKDTQDGIQQMSSWCLQRRIHHKKIVNSWLNVFKQVRVEHRLILFYLANDVIQYSKRKHYEFVDSWVTALQKATTMVRDDKVRDKICRIFNIWLQRDIYSEEYLSDLKGLLNIKKTNNTINTSSSCSHHHENIKHHDTSNSSNTSKTEVANEFQCSSLIKRINDSVKYSAETDKAFKKMPRTNKSYLDCIKSNMIKDRSHTEEIERDIENYVTALELYIKSLKNEIKVRHSLLKSIEEAKDFYGNQREEVKVVVNAYKNFGVRIKAVKKKLDEVIPNLPSPIPSPDIDAPSPEPDDDTEIALPDDDNNLLNVNLLSAGGTTSYVSYMDGNLPFDINDFKSETSTNYKQNNTATTTTANAQAIEVINTRNEETQRINFEINTFNSPISKLYTSDYNSTVSTFTTPGPPPPPVPTYAITLGVTSQPAQSMVPKQTTLVPPPPIPPILNDHSLEFPSPIDWSSSWNPGSANSSYNTIDTPVSPPHFEKEGNNLRIVEYDDNLPDDLVLFTEDIDHRNISLLPKEKSRLADVDHRNLISLTGSPSVSNSKAEVDFANSFLNDTSDDLFPQKDVDYRTHFDSSSTTLNTDLNLIPLKPPSSLIEIEQTCAAESELPPMQLLATPQSGDSNDALFSNFILGKSTDGNNSNDGLGTSNINNKDNTESVDMDVSDDDIENYIQANEEQQIRLQSPPSNNNLIDAYEKQKNDSDDNQSDYQNQLPGIVTGNNQMNLQTGINLPNDLPINQLDDIDSVNNSSWDNNWKQYQMNPVARINYPHTPQNQKHRYNSPRGDIYRYRGGGSGPRFPYQNKFHNNNQSGSPNLSKPPHHRGSPFFNRGGNRGSPMQQRGGSNIGGYQRGNFRGRPW